MILPPEPTASLPLINVPRKVDHLPFAGQILRELKVAKIIDAIVPSSHFRDLSTGTCVEAMVLSILQGSHALYRVGETLKGWDLPLILRKDIDPDQLRDTRLGRALDSAPLRRDVQSRLE